MMGINIGWQAKLRPLKIPFFDVANTHVVLTTVKEDLRLPL